MSAPLKLFATAPRGLEHVLARELAALGIAEAGERPGGVRFRASSEAAYTVCLWSRVANRVLLEIARFPAGTPEALYDGAAAIDWSAQFAPGATFAVDCTLRHSAITHSRYAAQKVKDAIVDRLRTDTGARPDVDVRAPDLRVNAFVDRNEATLYVDLSGESLHRRGYRQQGGAAPLKETLAAAVLLRTGWPAIAADGGGLVDPLCGSGTFPIEAAMIAHDVAPGALRQRFGFHGWRGHDEALWRRLRADADARREAGLARRVEVRGFDHDRAAVAAANANVERAGLLGAVHVERGALADLRPAVPRGLLVANPPYGERLGDAAGVEALYGALGDVLRAHFHGWRAAVLAANPELGFRLGLRAKKPLSLYNGALECKLIECEVDPARFLASAGRERATGGRPGRSPAPAGSGRAEAIAARAAATGAEPDPAAEALANRLRKNLRGVGRRAAREGWGCFRVYDADLPEYAVAIDVYECEARHLVVQEYRAPASVAPELADARLVDALLTAGEVLGVPAPRRHLRIRARQRGEAQYTKQGDTGREHVVTEGPCRYYVNFDDYLDTGVFIDHREVRRRIAGWSAGGRFLNLFGYTGTASVAAATGGAAATTTVDLSQAYLDWAARNAALNGLPDDRHRRVRADCLVWLDEAATAGADRRERYDLVLLNPPVFSNSKRMADTLDVQRDAPRLIAQSAALLAPGGRLVFATSLRRFRLATEALSDTDGRPLVAEDVSRETLPPDFRRRAARHHCWVIRHGA